MGFDLESSDKLNFKKMQDNFPTEIDLCGIFKFGECSDAEAHMQEILSCVDITDNPILVKCNGSGSDFQLNASQYRNGKLESIDYEIVSEEMLISSFLMTRLIGYIEVMVTFDRKSIKHEFIGARKKLASGNVIFQCENKDIFFNNNNVIGMNGEATLQDLLEVTGKKKTDNKKAKLNTDFNVINIKCLLKKSDENGKNQRGTLNFELDKQKVLIPIKIDAISALHINTQVTALYDILVESLCRTLRLIEENLLEQLSGESEDLLIPSTFHFKPDNFGHFYTCIYPDSIPDDDEQLTAIRRELHQQLGIPLTRPVFRRANNYSLENPKNLLLINPHVGLKSTVTDGKQSLVQGKYTYHHYMQDNFNDDGWGCAYRSLQTLCSWFRFQGYSSTAIPTHEEIQRYLVKVGDKQSNFINSRQWIGSTEVSMCLNGFMNVDSRIMHVSSGADLATKGSELAYHFESQGTPIMVSKKF